MAEQRMYKGRPVKPNVKIEQREINGEIKEVLIMPTGMKTPYADDVVKVDKKRTVKANPAKDSMLTELLTTLLTFSVDGNIIRTKQGKYAVKTAEDKWFSLALTANKTAQEGTLYEISTGEGE